MTYHPKTQSMLSKMKRTRLSRFIGWIEYHVFGLPDTDLDLKEKVRCACGEEFTILRACNLVNRMKKR